MRGKIVNLIKILGFGVNELVIDIPLSIGLFDTIELDPSTNGVFLHMFVNEDYDMVIDFDDISKEDQMIVYKTLSFIYN